jgi:repressor LexA
MKAEDIAQNIRLLRTNAGMSQADLGAKIGMNQGQIQKIETGSQSLKIEVIQKIAAALCVDPSELIFKIYPFPYRHIPIKGTVNAGTPIEAIEEIHCDTIPFDTDRSDLFALNVKGDSMDHIVPDGAVIIVDPTETDPKRLHNQPIVAIQDNESIFKVWNQDLKAFMPKSRNPDHLPIKPQYEMRVVGKVIAYIVRL